MQEQIFLWTYKPGSRCLPCNYLLLF